MTDLPHVFDATTDGFENEVLNRSTQTRAENYWIATAPPEPAGRCLSLRLSGAVTTGPFTHSTTPIR